MLIINGTEKGHKQLGSARSRGHGRIQEAKPRRVRVRRISQENIDASWTPRPRPTYFRLVSVSRAENMVKTQNTI